MDIKNFFLDSYRLPLYNATLNLKEIGVFIMSQKINLATLNKKKEEIDRKEMHELRGGRGCSGCGDYQSTNSTDQFMQSIEDCGCGSIFVIFGLAWG